MAKALFKFLLFFLIVFHAALLGCGNSDLSKSSKHSDTLLYKSGVQKYEVGDYESALALFEKALQINPENKDALLDVGILYEDYKKNNAKAMEAYQRFLLLHSEGDKAEMVKGWLMKLAVSEGKNIENLPEPKQEDSGALLKVSSQTIEENKKLKKSLEVMTTRLQEEKSEADKNAAALKKEILNLKEELAQSNKSLSSLKSEISRKIENSEEGNLKQIEELEAKLKQSEIRREQDKNEFAKTVQDYESTIAALKKDNEKIDVANDEKRDLISNQSKIQYELERLKEAFATATQERARLNELLKDKEATIGGLKGQLAKISQQKSFDSAERKGYDRQLAILKQKNSLLEEDRKKYLALLRKNTTEVLSKEPDLKPLPAVNRAEATSTVDVTPPRDYELVTYHRVKRGETLMMIAGYSHIYGDRSKWKLIYEANKTNIDDPNVLVPGQILLVPR